ncbi:hypothetical protein M9458_004895, partial [Cirrhinus mrigala]
PTRSPPSLTPPAPCSFRFRTWNPSGLLFFTPLMPGGVEVSLVEGKVTVHIYVSLGKNTRVDISSGNYT